MTLEYHYTNLAIYELGIGEGYRDPDAIKQQYFTLPTRNDGGKAPSFRTPKISAIRIDLTVKWMNAAHELLDFFLSCDMDMMRNIPNLVYTRVSVAMLSLLKIYHSVESGPLGEAIAPGTINVDMYLDTMARKLTEASSGGRYKVPRRWYHVVAVKGRDWYNRFQARQAQKDAKTTLTPPRKPSPPTSHNHPIPMSIPRQTQLDPTTHSQMGSFGVGMGLSQGPMVTMGYEGSGEGYTAPVTTVSSIWTSESHHNYLTMDHQFTTYPSNTLPPQLVYETQVPQQHQHPTDSGQNSNPFCTSGTGMELDGWVPERSIFGMPNLPE